MLCEMGDQEQLIQMNPFWVDGIKPYQMILAPPFKLRAIYTLHH